MKAFAVAPSAGDLVLGAVELPQPQPEPQEVVVAVRAAGVTPTELLWYPTTHHKDGGPRVGAVPGHEFSGEIAAVGSGVSRFRVGDEVFGMSDWFVQGATAEFCRAHQDALVLKPASLSHPVAAATPISALTAWQGLVERTRVTQGERVLIVGASGSVGRMAVQIARLQGCVVFGSASASAKTDLEALGCEEVLDFRTQPFEQHLSKIDVVFDTVGGDTLARAEGLLAPGGRMVTIAADAEGNPDPAIQAAFFIVEAHAEQLGHIAMLLEKGKLQTAVKAVLPLEEAPQAYAGTVRASAPGKLVLAVEA